MRDAIPVRITVETLESMATTNNDGNEGSQQASKRHRMMMMLGKQKLDGVCLSSLFLFAFSVSLTLRNL